MRAPGRSAGTRAGGLSCHSSPDKGRRPSWNLAAPGDQAEPLVRELVDELRRRGATVQTGVFGAMMQVASVNDGPFTVIVDV